MKITVIDFAIIALLALSLFSFSTKYQPKYEYEFSGSQIYKVVNECDKLDSSGFLYTVFAKGYWNVDLGHFEEEGFVTDTGRGFIQMVLADGRTVTIGGRMSYKEDIQATEIEIRIRSKSSVVYLLKPATGTKEDVKTYIEASASFIEYPKKDIAITASLTIGTDTSTFVLPPGIEDVLSSTDPVIEAEAAIEYNIRKTIFLMKKADIEIYDDGITIFVERLSLNEFDAFFEILESYFSIEGIYTSDILVFYQTDEEIDVNDVVPLEKYSSEQIYAGSIHVRV